MPTGPRLDIDEFMKRAKADVATREDALAVLEHRRKDLEWFPLEEQRASLRKTKAGGKILAWLWSKPSEELTTAMLHKSFANMLSWAIVGEGADQYIWQW